MRPHERKNLIKVGAFISCLSILFVVFVAILGVQEKTFESKITLKTRMENVQNLKRGGKVHLRGIKIGSISAIEFVSLDTLEVTMRIVERYSKWIKKDSVVSLKTEGVLGDKFVEIQGGTAEAAQVTDMDLLKTDQGFGVKEFINKGENILTTSTRVLAKMENILDQLGRNNRLATSMENFSKASNKLPTTVAKLDSILTRVEKGPGNIHRLIYDESIYNDLRTLLGGAQRSSILKYFVRETIKKSEGED